MSDYLKDKIKKTREIRKEYKDEMASIEEERLKIFEKFQSAIDKKRAEKIRQNLNEQ